MRIFAMDFRVRYWKTVIAYLKRRYNRHVNRLKKQRLKISIEIMPNTEPDFAALETILLHSH